MKMVGNVFHALTAAAELDQSIAAPAWLDQVPTLLPRKNLSWANGLLHLPSFALLSHTPGFFTHNAVDFAIPR